MIDKNKHDIHVRHFNSMNAMRYPIERLLSDLWRYEPNPKLIELFGLMFKYTLHLEEVCLELTRRIEELEQNK